MNGLLNNRKGTSLAEILVVMVILLVGIMYVVTMFPSGFRVVLAAESQTIATKLAQAEIERWKNMPGNLPDGILPLRVGYGDQLDPNNDVLNNQPPGPPFESFTPTSDPNVFDPGNVVNFRYVRNETTSIPVGSYFTSGAGAGYGSKYTLAFSPIEVTASSTNDGTYNGLTVKSGDLLRRRGDSDSDMYLRRGQYGVDYTLGTSNGNNYFYVTISYDHNDSHIYDISYSYWAEDSSGNAELFSTVDQPVHPDAGGSWVPVEITPPSGYTVTEVEENTDTCARGFVQVAGSWSNDPYEFALVDSIMGVIAFNPRAQNMTESTARGVRPITARIDYRIYDPRIIREDKVVQAIDEDMDGDHTLDHTAIKLALRFILNAGPVDSGGRPVSIADGDPTDNPDEPTFEGLIRKHLGRLVSSPDDVLVADSMLIIDLQTGLRVSMQNVAIDFKQGIVHLPEKADLIDWQGNPLPGTTNMSLAGRHLRFFYRADGDWSVQCHKAYTYYLRKTGTSQVDYCHFRLLAPDGGPYQLLFARCDSGKNVTVDYTYTDPQGTLHKVVGRTFKISDDWTVDTSSSVADDKVAYVTLDVPTGCKINPAARIVVCGASFKARVVWRDGKHWRFVDIDTNLTRNSSR